jgi:type VI secretion system ImpM family protein
MRPPPASPIGFFGKLPQFGDFVRHQAGAPIVLALDEWLREGAVALADAMPWARFLFHECGSWECLVGALRPSEDRTGRRFPFAAFAQRECGPWHPLAPILFAGWLADLTNFLGQATELASQDALVARTEALPPPDMDQGARDYDEFVRETLTEDFLDGALPHTDRARKVALAARLESSMFNLRGQPGRVDMRFPLADDAPDLFAAYWMELAGRMLGVLPAAPRVALWTESPPSLVLALGRPAGRQFAHLCGRQDDDVVDLLLDAPAPAAAASLPLVTQPALRLKEVLGRADKR